MSAKRIIGQTYCWMRTVSDYRRVGESVELEFRETPKFYMVTMPSGYVRRCRKFNGTGQPEIIWHDYLDDGDMRVTLELFGAQPTDRRGRQPAGQERGGGCRQRQMG
jgi:hypothetical protein